MDKPSPSLETALARWAALHQVLTVTLPQAVELLRIGEPWLEIRPQANYSS